MLGKFPVPGRPVYFDYSRAEPLVLAVGAGGGCLDISSVIYHFSFFFFFSLGHDPILSEILSQRAVKPKTTDQPTNPTHQNAENKLQFLFYFILSHNLATSLRHHE